MTDRQLSQAKPLRYDRDVVLARTRGRSGASGHLTILALALLLVACAASPGDSGSRPQAPGVSRRIVLVGLDAADWLAIDPLIRAGKLPTFGRLRSAGRAGVLVSEPPLLSPILWTTIATGRNPEDHGVLDFMVDLPSGGQAPVSSASRRVPAFWNLLSDAGRRVAVVGWWASWPAEPVHGTIVSDRVAPQLLAPAARLEEGAISPAADADRISASVTRPEQLSFEDLARYVPLTRQEHRAAMTELAASSSRFYRDPIAHLAAVVAATRSYSDIAGKLLERGQPDVLAVYLETIDSLSHVFIRDPRRGPAAIEAAYRDADVLLARLARASAPNTWFLVCSDHGFQPSDAAIPEDPADLTGPASAWHRPYGIVAAAEASELAGSNPPSAPRDAALRTATPLDITPTLLHATGLPVGDRMPGRVVSFLLSAEAVARPVAKATLPEAGPRAAPPASSGSDAERVARLRALGYIGGATTSLARQNLGEILYRRGNLAGAERELRAVVQSQPENLTAQLWLAKTLRDQGRAREALDVYEHALRLRGGRGEALIEAAELGATAGLAPAARRIVDGAAAGADNASALAVARAILARAEGHAPEAERELRSALARDPTSFDALSRLLDLLTSRGRMSSSSVALYRAAAERAPGSARHLALLGEVLIASGDPASATPVLGRALGLAPDSAPLRIDLARAQLGERKSADALATLADAPASSERSALQGAACSMQGRWTEAISHFQSAMEKNPETPQLLNGLAWAQLQLGRSGQAADLFGRSLSLDANQPEIRRLLAQIDRPSAAR